MSVVGQILELVVRWLRGLCSGGATDVSLQPTPTAFRRTRRRLKRRQLCSYLTAMIQNCSAVEGDAESGCDGAVRAALGFHSRSREANGGVCLMGKYHDVLYVAARLAFLFKLDNSHTVNRLLADIYHCEGTFERIVSGAIFGPRLCGAISGWKSEFDSREECVSALRYFLWQSTRGRAEYPDSEGRRLRMADVPLVAASRAAPATLAVQARRPDVFRLLVEYGADLVHVPQGLLSPLDALADMEEESSGRREEECLALGRELYPGGIGRPLPSLKQLARLEVRACLNQDFLLPQGVTRLQIPLSLVRYITLERN